MFACIDEFTYNIDSLIRHLAHEEKKDTFFQLLIKNCDKNNSLHDVINSHLNEVIKPSRTSSKEFNYTSSIIALYGYLESYLEKLTEEFITSINEADIPIPKLPQAILDRHLELSMKLLDKLTKDRTKEEVDKRTAKMMIIKNLHSFLQGTSNRSLNSKAFTIHTANFRYELIQSFFAQLGVNNIADRTLGFNTVINQLANRQGQDPSVNLSIRKTWLESELGDLAQLRNEIAHGSFERNIEKFNLIIERAEFIKQFGIALGQILHHSFTELCYHGSERHIIGNATRTFPQHSSFGFKGESLNGNSTEVQFKIKIGDKIFAHNPNAGNKVIIGSINSLMQNCKQVDDIQFPSETDFSIKVNFDVTNNMTNRELSILKTTEYEWSYCI